MADALRYIFATIGVIALLALVVIDKKYPGGQPIAADAYWIVGGFTLSCMIGAENLTKLLALFINKKVGDGK